MATNPARPQYQDIIDEAWGDQVADHVIRRYADKAERDADLAGIAPADLDGQVVALAAMLEIYNATAAGWTPIPIMDWQSGRGGYATDAASNVHIAFPRAFAGVPSICIAFPMWTASEVSQAQLLEGFLAPDGASFSCRGWANQDLPAGKAVNLQWFAVYLGTVTAAAADS
jgi:hypothetical protein